jgi:hypothetical protein
MPTEASICRALLEIIATVMERVTDLQPKLRVLPSVEATRSGLDIRKYSGAAVEMYVEADLKDTRNICWWLEFSLESDERWHVESRIYESHGDVLHRFADVAAEDLASLAEAVQEAAQSLVGSIDVIPTVQRALRGKQ